MTAPVRLQLSRRKGFDLQALSLATNGLPAVKVDRSTRFGNPLECKQPYGCPYDEKFDRYAWEEDDGSIHPFCCCVDAYRHYVETGLKNEPTRTGYLWFGIEAILGYPHRARLLAGLPSLRGKNLACWCKLGSPCHADVLLDLANRPICEAV